MDYMENQENQFNENEYEPTFSQEDSSENADSAPKRSGWLVALCVLTFIGSGFSFLGYLLCTAGYGFLPDIMEQTKDMMSQMYGDEMDFSEALQVQSRAYYALLSLLYGASVVGAALMLGLRKIGFHTYTIAQALLLIAPVVLIHSPFSWGDLMLTAAFVILYSTFLKQMR